MKRQEKNAKRSGKKGAGSNWQARNICKMEWNFQKCFKVRMSENCKKKEV